MKPLEQETLRLFATKYIWWKAPDEALKHPERIIAQVMNIGDYDDVRALFKLVDEEYLRAVLQGAEAGELNERSWTYWHYRLRVSEPGEVPALPERRVA
ncbi:MAG: hypothetical protein ACLQHF_17495 [Terracidiphilus sp.]